LVSLSPKACLPARSAHSAAWMLVLPPLIMFFFPLLRKKNVLLDRSLLKKNSHIPLTPWAQNRRGTFRIAERYDYRPVIKTPMPGAFVAYFSVRYTGASCCWDPQSLVCQSPITKLKKLSLYPTENRAYIYSASSLPCRRSLPCESFHEMKGFQIQPKLALADVWCIIHRQENPWPGKRTLNVGLTRA
jgi:hypothetical protein